MKKILSICLVLAIAISFGSCTKEAPNQGGQNPFYVPGGDVDPGGDTDPDPAPSNPVGDVPASFTKKVVIEKLTGEWCGACPSGGTSIANIAAANPGKVYPASWQMSKGDPFEIPEAQVWRSHLVAGASISGFSFPSASINRQLSLGGYPNAGLDKGSGDWTTQTNTALASSAECGLALVTTEADDKINVDVYIGYNNPIATSNTHITLYLIEDDVPESSPGAQAGGGGSYLHKHMIRDVITADLGDAIDLSTKSATNYIKLEYKDFDIAGKYHDKNNLKILAFVNIKEATGDKLGVLNAQEVDLGEIKKWD